MLLNGVILCLFKLIKKYSNCMSFSIELLKFYYILQKYESTMDWGKN